MYFLVMYWTHYPGPDPAGYCHFCLISGSGRVLIKNRSGSGSDWILIKKKGLGPVPAHLNVVSGKEHTEKHFFKKNHVKFKKSRFVQVIQFVHQFIARVSDRAYLHFVS